MHPTITAGGQVVSRRDARQGDVAAALLDVLVSCCLNSVHSIRAALTWVSAASAN